MIGCSVEIQLSLHSHLALLNNLTIIADMASGEERDVMGKMMTTKGGEKEGRQKAKGRKSMDHNPRALHLLQVGSDRTLNFLSWPNWVKTHFAHLKVQDISCHPHRVKTRLSKKKLFGNFVDAIL